MTEETEIADFVVKYSTVTRKPRAQWRLPCWRPPVTSKQQKLGKEVAGVGLGYCVTGGLGVGAKAAFLKVTGVSLCAKLPIVCAVVGTGGTALVGTGVVLAAGGIWYALCGDVNKEFRDECKESLVNRGMAEVNWPYVEDALKACINVLDGLDKRSLDLFATTRRCINLMSLEWVTPDARSICRYVVETCVVARNEDDYDGNPGFQTAFRESCRELRRCWQKEPLCNQRDGCAGGGGNVCAPLAGGQENAHASHAGVDQLSSVKRRTLTKCQGGTDKQ